MSEPIPALVLGGRGYVAGELLRLLSAHPRFQLAAVLSDSQPGEAVAAAFPHLECVYPSLRFSSEAQTRALLRELPRAALFGAAPHGIAAGLIDRLLSAAEDCGCALRVVDMSADFRYASAAAYEAVYGQAHGAPGRLAQFTCALPEHLATSPTAHVSHPGCFATAMLLASVPLLSARLIAPHLFVSAVTGSTGSGRKPVESTHHPLRHAELYSYQALSHRHVPEVSACAEAASGVSAEFAFVPLSGPFARGIHLTAQAQLLRPLERAQLLAQLQDFYRAAPLVRVSERAPHVKEVAGSAYAHLSVAVAGRSVALLCTLDNLNKGAAGGALQWMNRLFELPETCGLTAPAAGWT